MAEFETKYTDNAICPHCGHEDRDSWELSGESGTYWCGTCGEEINFVRNISISYSTSKPKPPSPQPNNTEETR